jgi:conjugal transfer/entry exclusion protein
MTLQHLLLRRHVLLASAVALLQQMLRAEAARADLWGGDLGLLSSILAECISTVSTLSSMATTLGQQLGDMSTMLSRLDPQSFEELAQLLDSNEMSFEVLAGDVNSIGYTLEQVNTDFQNAYSGDYTKTAPEAFDALYKRWADEILASAKVAARSQATLSSLESNTHQAKAILSRSASSDGEVAQMQAIVQMLGLIQGQNTAVVQSLTTTGRVLTTTAATTAAERHLARERRARALANYLDPGPAVPPITKLP